MTTCKDLSKMPDASSQTDTLASPYENPSQLDEGFIVKEKIRDDEWIALVICDSACSPQNGTQTEEIAPEFVERYERVIKVMNFEW
jgi:hypothetical protein